MSEYEDESFEATDEQGFQKANGRIETLQQELQRVKEELKKEQEAHQKTRKNTDADSGKVDGFLVQSFSEFSEAHKLDSAQYFSKPGEVTSAMCSAVLTEAAKKWKKTKKELKEQKNRSDELTKLQTSDPDSLVTRIRGLEEELRLALGAAEDIRLLKAKLLSMVDRSRTDKEARIRIEAEGKLTKKKVQMLTDHIEKLMTHLKHEAAAKIRALEQLRNSERETEKMKMKCILINRKSNAKDRLLLELREGSKILEDQLRLMDEKYLELRSKLDFARESGAKRVKKAERLAADLRVKFALAGGTGTLDNMPLPDIYGGSVNMGDSVDGSQWSVMSASQGSGVLGGPSSISGSKRAPGSKKKPKKTVNVDQVVEKIRQKGYKRSEAGPPVNESELTQEEREQRAARNEERTMRAKKLAEMH
jgi:hypothetical protein